MGTLDPNCPMQLWGQFIKKGQDTLNLLRTSCYNPKLSAYASCEGQFNFDRTPFASVGTRSLVSLDPSKQNTWQQHAVDAWYVGPVKQHNRCYRFIIPETKAYQITNTAKFFRTHCKLPAIEPGNIIHLAAQDLIKALLHKHNSALSISLKNTPLPYTNSLISLT